MVDIDITLIVQIINFLVLLIILNALLLKPVVKHLNERDGNISSSHEEAKANMDRAGAMLTGFEVELAETRVTASQAYNGLQQEGMAEQKTMLAKAKADAQDKVEKARKEIEGEAARARQIIKSEMEKLPKDIAAKLLGRAV